MENTSNQPAKTPKTRPITVINKGSARRTGIYACFPQIDLRGKWLEDIGFRSGHTVEVTCEPQKLIITLAKEQRFDDV